MLRGPSRPSSPGPGGCGIPVVALTEHQRSENMDIEEQVADSSGQAGFERAGAVVKDVADKAREKAGQFTARAGSIQVSEDIVDYARAASR